MSEPSDPVDGSPRIPGYVLVRQIGAGGSGTVYLAYGDDALRRPFAIKLFGLSQRKQYQRELAALEAIDAVRRETGSRDLVEVVGAGEVLQQPYVVMEYVPGGSLEALVRERGAYPVEQAAELTLPVLRALSLLHSRGLVHRDVKPGNVMVGEDGRARLGDFGLTRSLKDPVSSAGTPGFCAPELYSGERSLEVDGERIDIYSAAATLYFLITAQAPLPGRPDLFLLERAAVDRDLQALLFEGLAADPQRRIPTMKIFAERLSAWIRGSKRLQAQERSRYRWGVLAALSPLLVVGGAALVWYSSSDPPPALDAARGPASAPAPELGSAPGEPSSDTPAPPEPSTSTETLVQPPPPALLWSGLEQPLGLNPSGPRVHWTEEGGLQVGEGPTRPFFKAPPLAFAWDPAAQVLVAITQRGETIGIEVQGEDVRFLDRIPGSAEEESEWVAATDGVVLVRLETRRATGDTHLTMTGLRDDEALGVRQGMVHGIECVHGFPSASALAVAKNLSFRGQLYLPIFFLGLPSGQLVVINEEREETLRTHQDEILALAVDPARGELLVLGDDRQLISQDPPLLSESRLILKAYEFDALIDEGRLVELRALPCGDTLPQLPRQQAATQEGR